MSRTAVRSNRQDAQADRGRDTRSAGDKIASGYDQTVTPTHMGLDRGGALASAKLTNGEREAVRAAPERVVRERAGETGTAKLTSPIDIGIGTK